MQFHMPPIGSRMAATDNATHGRVDMASNDRVLVLGATGGIGGEAARQLRDAGWEVRALRRAGTSAVRPAAGSSTVRSAAGTPVEHKDGIVWLRGDALRGEDVAAAAAGCSVIVHAVNPPAYRRWPQLVLPMLDNTIAAAANEQATVVLPGTVYNYGPDAYRLVTEDAPQNPVTRKGAIRVAMERRLESFSQAGGRVLIVRAGDFFGPAAANNWFSQGLIRPGRAVTRISYPGRAGVGHQWAYLPDVARTMLELLKRRDSLQRFAAFHMEGHWDHDGTQMAQAIRRVVARRTGIEPAVTAFPWWLIAAGAPIVETFREMREMRYLWRVPVRMVNDRLRSVLGAEPRTPLEQAVEASLGGLGCI